MDTVMVQLPPVIPMTQQTMSLQMERFVLEGVRLIHQAVFTATKRLTV